MLPGLVRVRHLPLAPRGALLRHRADGTRPARRLRAAGGHPGRGGRAVAGAEPGGRGSSPRCPSRWPPRALPDECVVSCGQRCASTRSPIPSPSRPSRSPAASRRWWRSRLPWSSAVADRARLPRMPRRAAVSQMNLATRHDWVQQKNFVQCVGHEHPDDAQHHRARPRPDQGHPAQAPGAGPRVERPGAPRHGAQGRVDPGLGRGPRHPSVAAPTASSAPGASRTRCASRQPPSASTADRSGLLVWGGRHAWVMAGFEATGDPLLAKEYERHEGVHPRPALPVRRRRLGPEPQAGDGDLGRGGRPPVRPPRAAPGQPLEPAARRAALRQQVDARGARPDRSGAGSSSAEEVAPCRRSRSRRPSSSPGSTSRGRASPAAQRRKDVRVSRDVRRRQLRDGPVRGVVGRAARGRGSHDAARDAGRGHVLARCPARR